MTELQMLAQLHVRAQLSQSSLSPPLQRALFTSSHDGKIPRDAVVPAIVGVLFYDVGVEPSEAERLAGLVAERLAPTAFQPIHEAMAKARSHDFRHEIADLQAALVVRAVSDALTSFDFVDPRRKHLRALLG